MRILHVGKFFPPHPGGMEVFLADLIDAQHRQGLFLVHQLHAQLEHGAGVGAVADQVTEQRKALGALGPGMGQASFKALEVGVDV